MIDIRDSHDAYAKKLKINSILHKDKLYKPSMMEYTCILHILSICLVIPFFFVRYVTVVYMYVFVYAHVYFTWIHRETIGTCLIAVPPCSCIVATARTTACEWWNSSLL